MKSFHLMMIFFLRNAMSKTSENTKTYLAAFATLSEVNAVKRSFPGTFFPMKQTPSCISHGGCSFALELNRDEAVDVIKSAERKNIYLILYSIEYGTRIKYTLIEKNGGEYDLSK